MIYFYVIVFLILVTAAWGSLSAAPWLPTRSYDVVRMIEMTEVKKGDKAYDLGCGDGRLVFSAAKKGAEAVGIEIFILPYFYAKLKSYFIPGSKIRFGDFFRFDLRDADVVFIFLLDSSYKRLISKLEKELKPGTRMAVAGWPIKEWENKLVISDKPSAKNLPVYLYKI